MLTSRRPTLRTAAERAAKRAAAKARSMMKRSDK